MNWFDLPAPDPSSPPPAFIEPEAARAWLAKQPQAVPLKVVQAIAGQLDLIAKRPLPVTARLAVLDALKTPATAGHASVRRKFAFQPRPLAAEGHEAFRSVLRVWDGLATGYLQCLEALADEAQSASDTDRRATVAHRAMTCCRMALEDHFVAGVEAPALLNFRLQRLLQAMHAIGVTGARVVDPDSREAGPSTPVDQYVLAALLILADPYRMTAGGFAVSHRAFSRWLNQASLSARSSDDPKLRWVPLSAIAPLPPALGEGSPEWLEVHLVRRKLRKRIESLDAGESPDSLALGKDLSAAACRELLDSNLEHLRAAYSEGRERMVRVDAECEIAVGPNACFEIIADKPFNPSPALTSASDRILHERVAIFGTSARVEAVASRDQEANVRGERWRLLAESIDATEIARSGDGSATSVLPGQLVVIRDGRKVSSLASVTRAWTRRDGRTECIIRRFPGRPEALSGKPAGQPGQPPFPVFLLPEVAAVGSRQSLVVPAGMGPRLRDGVEVRGDHVVVYRLDRPIERGADFERYHCQTV